MRYISKFFMYERIPKNWGKITSIGILVIIILASISPVTIGNAQQTSETIDIRISTSLDDVEERSSDGMMYTDSSDLELGDDVDWYGDQIVGLRFQNVTIPSGATIQIAYLEFETDETWNTATTVEIRAEDVDNASAFSTSNHDLSSRLLTAISSIWEIPPWNSVNEIHQSPDIADVVQEVVNRPGWAAGNSLAFLIQGTGTRTAESYDGERSAAPLLHLEYTFGDPTSTPTDSPSSTPTYTHSPSPSPSPIGTPTNTSTVTPSQEPSSIPSATTPSTATDTNTPSPLASDTPTNTPTNTFTPTTTPSETPTSVLEPTELLVYPYLGEITTNSVSISWVTDHSGYSEIRYSFDLSYDHITAAVDHIYDGKYWHSATISGLSADTIYHYKIFTNSQDLTPWSEITFSTAPSPDISPFTFVAMGDTRSEAPYKLPNPAALEIAAELELHQFDFAIHAGDIVHSGGICSGDDSSWNQYIRTYFDLYKETLGDTPFYPAIGGHEFNGGSCGYQAYTDVYQLPMNAPSGYEEQYYSFDWGNTHIVSLDVLQDYTIGSPQYNWLVDDLQTTTQTWKVIIFHDPPYSSGNHGSSTDIQNHLVPVFETYGVDVVFNGHDHDYERTCPIFDDSCTTTENGGVVYIVSGGGGADLYDVSSDWFTEYSDSIHHFVKVEVDDCWMQFDAIDSSGVIFDSYTIDHCTTSPTSTPTPSLTATFTTAPSPTISPTPSDVPSSTPTPSLTATFTPVPLPSNSPTPSDVPTSTPTPSLTATFTPVPSPTNSPTPSDVPTSTPTPSLTATFTPAPSPTSSPTPSDVPTSTPTPSPSPGSNALIYVSSSTNGTAGDVYFEDEDILLYDVATGTWSMYMDGSDVGLSGVDLNAFAFMPDNSILMSFNAKINLPGLGSVDDSDIVRFIPISTGNDTSGNFSSYLSGADSGLSKNSEDIDAISFTPEEHLVISTTGSLKVSGVSADDEDLIVLGDEGNWSMYFDGSDLGFGHAFSEDINGVHIDPSSNQIYLTILGTFSIPDMAGTAEDIVLCIPVTLGNSTECSLQSYWAGSLNDFVGNPVDGIQIVQ